MRLYFLKRCIGLTCHNRPAVLLNASYICKWNSRHFELFGSNVYMHQNFLKVVAHVIIIDYERLYEIQETIIYSRAILITVISAQGCQCRVKRVIVEPAFGHWQTVQTQIRRRRTRCLIRVCTVCLDYRKLKVKWNSLKICLGTFSKPILRDNRPTSAVSTLIS